jgi:hypothetical protein
MVRAFVGLAESRRPSAKELADNVGNSLLLAAVGILIARQADTASFTSAASGELQFDL